MQKSIRYKNKDGRLLKAVLANDIVGVKKALAAGADIDMRTLRQSAGIGKGFTPLLIAANRDFADVFQVMLDSGADAHEAVEVVKDSSQRIVTPLMEASLEVSEKVLDKLLAMGVDVHQQDNKGRTALLLVCENYVYEHFQLIQKLAAAGSDINMVDEQGFTPLMWVVLSASGIKLDDRNINNVVQWFIDNDADIFHQNDKGKTVLDIAEQFKRNDLSDFMRSVYEERRLAQAINCNDQQQVLAF